jgi:ParB-like chromosome segregation protein Spo0J
MPSKQKIIFLADIHVAESPKVRFELNPAVVEEYAENYKRKDHGMPAPVLFQVGKSLLIADGHHRRQAMATAGLKAAVFEVRIGTHEDCVRFALQANIKHGLMRTNADKRASAKLAITEFPKEPDTKLAELAGVSDKTVASVRKAMQEAAAPAPAPAPAEPEEPEVDEAPAKGAKDSTGHKLTERALVFWKRKDEAKSLMQSLSNIKRILNKAQKEKDLLYFEVNFNAVEANIAQAYTGLSVAVPHAVCPTCQGLRPDSCRVCGGRGVISKFRYERTTPETVRKIREKNNERIQT